MARLSLSSLFGDYAVFPKGLPISVFGESDTAGRVTRWRYQAARSAKRALFPKTAAFRCFCLPLTLTPRKRC